MDYVSHSSVGMAPIGVRGWGGEGTALKIKNKDYCWLLYDETLTMHPIYFVEPEYIS